MSFLQELREETRQYCGGILSETRNPKKIGDSYETDADYMTPEEFAKLSPVTQTYYHSQRYYGGGTITESARSL